MQTLATTPATAPTFAQIAAQALEQALTTPQVNEARVIELIEQHAPQSRTVQIQIAERQPTESEGKILKICVDICFKSKTPGAEIIRRGAQIAAAIYSLELRGYRVELSAIFTAHFHATSRDFTVQFGIKASDQPLEIDRIAFFLTHPATFRRLCLALIESQPDCNASYGRCQHYCPDAAAVFISAEGHPLQQLRIAGLL